MKLWQAILIGCDRRAQAFKSLFVKDLDGKCRSCAFGAAYEATFGVKVIDVITNDQNTQFSKAYPVIFQESECPCCGCFTKRPVEDVVTHLNDNHRWLREKIAREFVKPIEEEVDASSDS